MVLGSEFVVPVLVVRGVVDAFGSGSDCGFVDLITSRFSFACYSEE